jgi:probable F420-dependent oxidoreductase
MKLGISLGMLNPKAFEGVVLEAERLGFESVWLPEHLIFPVDMSGSPFPGAEHPPVPPTTPVFDVFGMLGYFAGKTANLRLGTNVYLLGLRHPFVAARAIQTLDILSGGRAEVGIGAGWLRNEWTAAGMDPRTRGRRLDEALQVCKRLWTEEIVEHRGEFYSFAPVAFEPKPLQRPHPPLHCGGESDAALRRAARDCDGWLGLGHTLESVAEPIAKLARLREDYGRSDQPFEIIVSAQVRDPDELRRFEDAGVTRIMAAPWERSRDAIEGLRRYADRLLR